MLIFWLFSQCLKCKKKTYKRTQYVDLWKVNQDQRIKTIKPMQSHIHSMPITYNCENPQIIMKKSGNRNSCQMCPHER